jgi:predicted secreted protein
LRQFAGFLVGLVLLMAAGNASAGDTSSLNVLGYSPDGKVFGFEEYGIADGSGFPYANVFLIDIAADKFLPGTPIRVQVEEDAPLSQVRKTARAKAAPLLEKYRLEDNPGVIVAYNPPSELDSDPYRLRFKSFVSAPPHGYTNALALKVKDFPVPASCSGFADSYKGFTLTLTEHEGRPGATVVHDDKGVPASRLCPLDYSIGAVVSSEIREGTMIAMILVHSYGFEGPDRRWIAVPIDPYGP